MDKEIDPFTYTYDDWYRLASSDNPHDRYIVAGALRGLGVKPTAYVGWPLRERARYMAEAHPRRILRALATLNRCDYLRPQLTCRDWRLIIKSQHAQLGLPEVLEQCGVSLQATMTDKELDEAAEKLRAFFGGPV